MGLRDRLSAWDDRALAAAGFADEAEMAEADAARREARAARVDERRAGHARFLVRSGLVLAGLLLLLAVLLAVTGDGDTAGLLVALAAVAGLAAGARAASARWARRL